MKTWEKPVLIILTRNAAEFVLSFCKNGDPGDLELSNSPHSCNGGCVTEVPGSSCGGCQQLTDS